MESVRWREGPAGRRVLLVPAPRLSLGRRNALVGLRGVQAVSRAAPCQGGLGTLLPGDGVEFAFHVTPAPDGVGPMTVTMLLENTIQAAERAATL